MSSQIDHYLYTLQEQKVDVKTEGEYIHVLHGWSAFGHEDEWFATVILVPLITQMKPLRYIGLYNDAEATRRDRSVGRRFIPLLRKHYMFHSQLSYNGDYKHSVKQYSRLFNKITEKEKVKGTSIIYGKAGEPTSIELENVRGSKFLKSSIMFKRIKEPGEAEMRFIAPQRSFLKDLSPYDEEKAKTFWRK